MGEDISANGQSWLFDALPPESYDDQTLQPDQQQVLGLNSSFTVEQIDQSRFAGPFRFNTQEYDVSIPGAVVGGPNARAWLIVQVTPKHDYGSNAGVGTFRHTEQGRERVSASEFFLVDPSALDESGLVRIGAGNALVLDPHSGDVIKASGERVEPLHEAEEEPVRGLEVVVNQDGEVLLSNRGDSEARLVTPHAESSDAAAPAETTPEAALSNLPTEPDAAVAEMLQGQDQSPATALSDGQQVVAETAETAEPTFDVEQAVGHLAEVAASGDGEALHNAIGQLIQAGASSRVLDQLPLLAHNGAQPYSVVNQLLAAGNEGLVLSNLSKLTESGLPPMAVVNELMGTNRAEALIQHAAELSSSGIGPNQLVHLLVERDRTSLLMSNLSTFSTLGLSRGAIGGILLDAQRQDFVMDHLEELLEGSNSLELLERVVISNDLVFQSPDRLASFISSHADLVRSNDVRGYLRSIGIQYVLPREIGNNTDTIFVQPLGADHYMLPDGYKAPFDPLSQY